MRLTLLLFFSCIATATAQQQQRSLVDRLLRPDTTLANSQQNKQFGTSAVVQGRASSARSFYLADKNLTKAFTGSRQFTTASFDTTKFTTKPATIHQAPLAREFPTRTARDLSTSSDAEKRYAARTFAGERPFLGRGKSQKFLHGPDHPLTIEEVRELLNKNK